jgi:hypothetical protein
MNILVALAVLLVVVSLLRSSWVFEKDESHIHIETPDVRSAIDRNLASIIRQDGTAYPEGVGMVASVGSPVGIAA